MDVVLDKWFCEMGTEEYNILNDFGFTPDQDHHHHQDMIEESLKKCLSSESSTITGENNNGSDYSTFKVNPTASFEARPSKQLKTDSSSRILCFDNSSKSDTMIKPKKETVDLKFSSLDHHHHHQAVNIKREIGTNDQFARPISMKESNNNNNNNNNNKRTFSAIGRSIFHAQDHVMAERKRREKLGQRFIALSAIVPGLKKTDKASVLGEAIKYLKEMQERVNTLEEQCKKRTMESFVFVKRSQSQVSWDDHDSSSSNEVSDVVNNEEASAEIQFLPEIEARILDKDVLIRIHSEKRKGVTMKILTEVEKLHLCVVQSSVVPFGSSTFDITTIVAKMDNQFNMSGKALVKTLRLALLNII